MRTRAVADVGRRWLLGRNGRAASKAVSESDIRELAVESARSEGIEWLPGHPVINEVDPHTFNYSLEAPVLDRYRSFCEIDHAWRFSSLQPCIRAADFRRWRKCRDRTHIAAFTIWAVDYHLRPRAEDLAAIHRDSIRRLWTVLVEKLGLNPRRMEVLYFDGAQLSEALGLALEDDFYVEPDRVTRETFLDLGLPRRNLFGLSTPETFLAQFPVPVDFWAGYRYEVMYRYGRSDCAVEVATGEALNFRRVVVNGRMARIDRLNGSVAACVIGVERVLMARDGLEDIYATEPLQTVATVLERATAKRNTVVVNQMSDAIRAVARIVADGGVYRALNRSLRSDLNGFWRALHEGARELGVSDEAMEQAFRANAQRQPWYPELQETVPLCVLELSEYRNRRLHRG